MAYNQNDFRSYDSLQGHSLSGSSQGSGNSLLGALSGAALASAFEQQSKTHPYALTAAGLLGSASSFGSSYPGTSSGYAGASGGFTSVGSGFQGSIGGFQATGSGFPAAGNSFSGTGIGLSGAGSGLSGTGTGFAGTGNGYSTAGSLFSASTGGFSNYGGHHSLIPGNNSSGEYNPGSGPNGPGRLGDGTLGSGVTGDLSSSRYASRDFALPAIRSLPSPFIDDKKDDRKDKSYARSSTRAVTSSAVSGVGSDRHSSDHRVPPPFSSSARFAGSRSESKPFHDSKGRSSETRKSPEPRPKTGDSKHSVDLKAKNFSVDAAKPAPKPSQSSVKSSQSGPKESTAAKAISGGSSGAASSSTTGSSAIRSTGSSTKQLTDFTPDDGRKILDCIRQATCTGEEFRQATDRIAVALDNRMVPTGSTTASVYGVLQASFLKLGYLKVEEADEKKAFVEAVHALLTAAEKSTVFTFNQKFQITKWQASLAKMMEDLDAGQSLSVQTSSAALDFIGSKSIKQSPVIPAVTTSAKEDHAASSASAASKPPPPPAAPAPSKPAPAASKVGSAASAASKSGPTPPPPPPSRSKGEPATSGGPVEGAKRKPDSISTGAAVGAQDGKRARTGDTGGAVDRVDMTSIFALACACLSKAYPEERSLADVAAFVRSYRPNAAVSDDVIELVLFSHSRAFHRKQSSQNSLWSFAAFEP